MGTEKWKDIPNYEGYQVSNLGNVRTKNKISFSGNRCRKWKDRVLKQKIGVATCNPNRKDCRVSLWKDGKGKTFLVARLVAFTFYGKNINDKKLTVNHIDGNSMNNNIKNLEIITLRDNIQKAIYTGLYKNKQIQIKLTIKNKNMVLNCSSMAQASRILKKNKGYISGMIKNNIFENKNAKWELI